MIMDSSQLQHKIDLNYAIKKRSSSLKWSIVNGVFLMVFVYDLSCKCSGYTSVLHYAELALAAVACANLLQHGARLLRPAPPPPAAAGAAPAPTLDLDSDNHFPQIGCIGRASPPARSPPRGASPPSPPSPHSPERRDLQPPRDEFISDRQALQAYLGQQTRGPASPEPRWPASAAPPPLYQLSAPDSEGTSEEGGASSPSGAAAPHVWRRLNVDPQRLTQYNLNLRLWIHVTILERVVRELAAADAALAALGQHELRPGLAPLERLRKAARAQGGALAALLPFLEPFVDQRYLVARLRALAAGGCLSEFRWRGGGANWRDGLPTDAELVLHLVATYLDLQLPATRSFSSQHVSAAPGAPPRGPHVLCVHRTGTRPPHYVLVRGEDTLEAGAGRNNLLHVLLLFLAAAAQHEPPALQRVHLGPAALNMLWIIGR